MSVFSLLSPCIHRTEGQQDEPLAHAAVNQIQRAGGGVEPHFLCLWTNIAQLGSQPACAPPLEAAFYGDAWRGVEDKSTSGGTPEEEVWGRSVQY